MTKGLLAPARGGGEGRGGEGREQSSYPLWKQSQMRMMREFTSMVNLVKVRLLNCEGRYKVFTD